MNMESRIKLPKGFRFNPFEKELITSYLKPKVLREQIPCDVVEERQLYGPNANPWQVFDPKNHSWIEHEVSSGKFEKVAYVFVNLTKKAANSVNKNNGGREQFIKKAGCGCWDGQTSRSEIRDSTGDVIGEKRLLVFQVNEVSHQEDLTSVGYWKMHEFSLCGVNNNVANPSNTVLCKITLDSSKNPPIKLKKPQKNNNNKKNTKNMLVNVSSPSTVSSAVVDAHVEGISENCGQAATKTCRDDGLELIDRPKGEELCYQSHVVQTCDDVWRNTIFDHGDGLGIANTLLEEVDPRQVSLDYCLPANQGQNLFMSEFEFEFPSYLEPTHEQPVEDFTNNMGKRKFHAETSYAMSKRFCC